MKIASSIWVRILLIVSSLQTIALGGMEIAQIVLDYLFCSTSFDTNSSSKYQYIFANEIILVSSEIFQCILFFTAAFSDNILQLIAAVVFLMLLIASRLLEADRSRIQECVHNLVSRIDISNVTATLVDDLRDYEEFCPEPFIRPDVNNLQELYDGLVLGAKYLEYKNPIHTASMVLCIVIVAVQLFCVYKIYLDYGYVMFRNEGASIEKRCKYYLDLKTAIVLRIQSFSTIIKVYTFFSMAVALDMLSISIWISEIPTLAILYGVATLFAAFAGYYGFRDLNYYLSTIHISMIISQFVILGFMYVIVQQEYEGTNHWWNLSLMATKTLINTYLLINAIWCILDFPARSRDDIQFIHKKNTNQVYPEAEKTRFLID